MRNSRRCSTQSKLWALPRLCYIRKSWNIGDCLESSRRLAMSSSSCSGQCEIGDDFDGKVDIIDEPVTYLISLKCRSPVKMVMDYDDEFIAGNPRHASIVKVKSGVSGAGRMLPHHMRG